MTTYDDSDYRFEPDAEYLEEHERRKAMVRSRYTDEEWERKKVGYKDEPVYPHECFKSEHWKGNRGREQ